MQAKLKLEITAYEYFNLQHNFLNTKTVLNILKTEVSKENYNKNEFIIIAEERLRIKQNILLP